MPASEVFAQAMEHIPALLLTYLTIFVAYWTLGIINIPRWAGRDALLDRIGQIDPAGIDRQSFSALAVISIVSLFMELLLIRWVTSEIRVFAYFKSFILIACFLGFGLGCYLTRKRIRIAYTLIPLIALAILIEVPWDPMRRLIMQLSAFIAWFSDVHMFGRAYFSGLPLWGFVSAGMAVTIVIPVFGLVALSFVPIGQLVGSYLENSRRGVAAYSINVAASLGGIWVFTLLAWLSTPPWVWFLLLFAGLLVFFARNAAVRRSLLITAGVIGVLFVFGSTKRTWWGEDNWRGARQEELTLKPGDAQVLWSPYQKLTVAPLLDNGKVSRIIISTNDSWFQGLMDLSDPQTQKEEADFQGAPIQFHQYNLPYRFLDAPPARVLIAGGGMGNDAASAIRNGAGSVDVVEIDPLIVSKGRDIHFEHPYRNPKVNVHVDDARAYLERAKGPYDLVVFSILDSHTTTSNYTNIRLDNYVYTLESMQRTRSLMGPNGVFVMSFSMERPWFAQRLKDVLSKAFDKEPLLLRRRAGNFFVISTGNQVEKSLAADPGLKAYVDSLEPMKLEPAEPLIDDWPYLYSQYRGIPVIIWVMSLGLVLVCSLAFKRLKQSRGGLNWHLFFLGAAFMLLEVQVISKTALLFGTTWLVNSFVITALLLFILLANLVAAWLPKFPRSVAYTGLFITLVISYLVPANTIFFDSMAVRAAAAMALYCSPVFFAGLVFISSFRETGFAAEAFGSNLLGSLVGGLLDSLSFAVGLNALVLVAALLYGLSLVSRRAGVPEGVAVTSPS